MIIYCLKSEASCEKRQTCSHKMMNWEQDYPLPQRIQLRSIAVYFLIKILCIAITLSGSITQPMMSEEIKMSSTPKFLTATSCYWQIWMVIGLRAVPKITTLSFMLRSLGLTTWMWFTMDEDQEIMVKEGWNSCGYSGLNTVASTQPWAGCIFNWMPYNFHHCQRTAHLDLLIQMTCFEELPLFPHLQLDRLTWIVWACQYSQGMKKTG